MTTNRPLRVFLCHSSADKPAVRELYQKLRAEPWIQPWLDEEELFPGMDWNLEIEKAIEATDVILVCLSNNSITKEGYVQREIRIALDYADYKPEGTLFIIPVRLEECKPPKRLARWQYADYFEGKRERSFERLQVSLKRHVDVLGLKYEGQNSSENNGELSPKSEKTDLVGMPVALEEKPINNMQLTVLSLQQPQDQRINYSSRLYPNKFGLIILQALEEILGKTEMINLLKISGLNHFIDKYPPDNLDKGFEFSDVSAIFASLKEISGSRGGKGIAMRVGRSIFYNALKNSEPLRSAADMVFVLLPLHSQLRIGLPSFAKVLSQLSDQDNTVEEKDTHFVWTVHECPCCWGQTGFDKPICYMVVGLLQESLAWFSGGKEFRVDETKCKAIGDQVCEFIIQKTPNK